MRQINIVKHQFPYNDKCSTDYGVAKVDLMELPVSPWIMLHNLYDNAINY